MVPPAEFRSYHGRPVLKPPAWDWKVPAYLFTGGLSAGSALLAAGADLTGRPALRRATRLGALASLGASTYLLVADLGRPSRFHHMLRVAKPTSPMSVGSWILAAYAPGIGAAALAELLAPPPAGPTPATPLSAAPPSATPLSTGPPSAAPFFAGLFSAISRRMPALLRGSSRLTSTYGEVGHGRSRLGSLARLARVVARPAGLSSAAVAPAVASYTAVLLSQTAVPAWHEAHPYLPAVFTGSAAASAGGLGMVLAPVSEAGPARTFAAYGGLCELAASRLLQRRLGLVAEAYHTGRAGRLRRWSEALTAAGVLGTLAARRNRTVAVAAGLSLLAGSALQRFGTFEAGVASTRDPKYVVVPQRQRLDARA